MKKAVVTGGAGFIGSHLVDALLKSGAELLVVDDMSTGDPVNLQSAIASGGSRLRIVENSVTSPAAVSAVVDFSPDVVFHLAAQMNVRLSVDQPAFDADANVVGTVQMLEAARQAGAGKFVFSSTGGAIYGEQEVFPADEQHPIKPKSPYGVSKRAAELYLDFYAREFGLNVTSLRFGNVYGPRQNPKGEAGVVAIFAVRALKGEVLGVNGDGEQTRDFVYIDDVISACLTALELGQPSTFDVFNVGLGQETSVNDIVAAMRSVWPTVAPSESGQFPEVEFRAALAGEQKRSVINPAKLTQLSSWKPRVSLEDGIGQTVKSFTEKSF